MEKSLRFSHQHLRINCQHWCQIIKYSTLDTIVLSGGRERERALGTRLDLQSSRRLMLSVCVVKYCIHVHIATCILLFLVVSNITVQVCRGGCITSCTINLGVRSCKIQLYNLCTVSIASMHVYIIAQLGHQLPDLRCGFNIQSAILS